MEKLEETSKILLTLALRNNNVWEDVYNAVKMKQMKFADGEVEDYLARLEAANASCGAEAVTLVNSNYPKFIKRGTRPSFVLFYRGDLSLIDKHARRMIHINMPETYLYEIAEEDEMDLYNEIMKTYLEKDFAGHYFRENHPLVIYDYDGGDAITLDLLHRYYGMPEDIRPEKLPLIFFTTKPITEHSAIFNQVVDLGGVVISYRLDDISQSSWRDHISQAYRGIAQLTKAAFFPQVMEKSNNLELITWLLGEGRDVSTIPTSYHEYRYHHVINCRLISEGAQVILSAGDLFDLLH